MLDPITIIKTVGVIGVIAIIFAETGLFFGFFFPGDSLLFVAGLFASQGYLNIWVLLIGIILAAIIGDTVGYWTGRKWGRKLFEKEDNLFFKKKHLIQTETFYEKHGKFTIIIARFVPIVRTFAPIVAGVAKMEYKTFVSYNIFGGILWPTVMILSAYFLGEMFPQIEKYLFLIIFVIIFLSFLPIIFKILKIKRKKQ